MDSSEYEWPTIFAFDLSSQNHVKMLPVMNSAAQDGRHRVTVKKDKRK